MKFNRTKKFISIPIYLSPLILGGVLFETQRNGAFPPDADSASIPLFFYLLFIFPIACWILGKVPNGELGKLKSFLWDSSRPWFSGISLILTIYPLALFWIGFTYVSFTSGSYISGILCGMVFCALILSRSYAIQAHSEIN